MTAMNFLLYPIVIILSYTYFGVTGLCWAGLGFTGFFTLNTVLEKKNPFDGIIGWSLIIYGVLMTATLMTLNTMYLQIIPSVFGGILALITGLQAVGFVPPRTEREIKDKQKDESEYVLIRTLCAIAGFGLFAVNERLRITLDFDSWVWFFGFVRIEFMLATLIIATPAITVFAARKMKNS